MGFQCQSCLNLISYLIHSFCFSRVSSYHSRLEVEGSSLDKDPAVNLVAAAALGEEEVLAAMAVAVAVAAIVAVDLATVVQGQDCPGLEGWP